MTIDLSNGGAGVTDGDPTALRGPIAIPGEGTARKLASQVASRIEADILASGWQVGTVFGSESALRERYGVSRAVLREAIRLVEHHEVATMRRGPSGGLIVKAPQAGPLAAAMVIYLEHTGAQVEELLAVRLLLEPLAARLAADRMDEEGIQALRATLEQDQASPDDLGGSDLLHKTLGQLSRNPALRLFIDVLVELTNRYVYRPSRASRGQAAEVKRASHLAHRAIANSVIAGDTSRAEQRTVHHLEAMRDWMLSIGQRPIASTQRADVDDTGNGKQKLAETVARRIMGEMAARGAHVGDVVGSEADLLERMGVSRAVLREAVRLLEYHSVAYMRRGPGGGLVITVPDATASIQATALYLDYEEIGLADLRAVRDVIESGCLESVVRRHEDTEVAERLREAIKPVDPVASEATVGRAHHFHTEIAELSGNPVLALFLRIITTVWARHSDDLVEEGPKTQEAADAALRVHEGIAEAILAGDLPLARHRMRRHLEALDAWWQ